MRILVTCLLLVSGVFARQDHLVPVAEELLDISSDKAEPGYHELVFRRLFEGQKQGEVFMLEIASFCAERLLILGKSSGSYWVTMRKPRIQIWDNPEKNDSRVIGTTTATIDARLAGRIKALWHYELHEMRPEREPSDTLDGVSYYFGGSFQYSEKNMIWSHEMIGVVDDPQAGTSLGAVAEVATLLLRYLELPEDLRKRTTKQERLAWMNDVAAGKIVVDWPLVLDGENIFTKDEFLADPWANIEKKVREIEQKVGPTKISSQGDFGCTDGDRQN